MESAPDMPKPMSSMRTIKSLGVKTLALRCDLVREEDIDHVITETIKEFGMIDILVNNAGIVISRPFMEKTVEAILDELNRLKKEGVTVEELHRAKVNIESDLIYSRQTVQGQAGKIGFYEVIAGDAQFEKEYMRRIHLVQSEKIQNLVNKYFKKSRMVISLLVPTEKADVLKTLSLNSTVEKVKFDEPFTEKKEKGGGYWSGNPKDLEGGHS
jgi:hypothetical protein